MLKHQNETPVTPNRCVVLGAHGFVARYVINALRGGGSSVLELSSTDVDLCQPESVDQLQEIFQSDDSVVFVSALTPDKGRDIRTLMRNLSMAEHVCAAMSVSPCSHLVYVSSDAVYRDDVALVRETSCCDPSSFHGVMHLARERMLQKTAQDAGVPLAILRGSLLYGAGDTHNGYGPNRFLRTALDSRSITLFGGGEEKRDHMWVGDLATLITSCLTHRSDGILNVATGQSVSFFDAAQVIGALVGNDVRIEQKPRGVAITHRNFDVTACLKSFPSFQYALFKNGIAETHQVVVRTTAS